MLPVDFYVKATEKALEAVGVGILSGCVGWGAILSARRLFLGIGTVSVVVYS